MWNIDLKLLKVQSFVSLNDCVVFMLCCIYHMSYSKFWVKVDEVPVKIFFYSRIKPVTAKNALNQIFYKKYFWCFRVFFLHNDSIKKKMADLASDQNFSGILDSQAPMPSDMQTPAPANMDIDDSQQPARPQRRTGYAPENIPRVVDQTALAVMDAFEKFLET